MPRVSSIWRATVTLLLVLCASACGPLAGVPGDGKILIAWTLNGQPPSETTCSGIDMLEMTLQTAGGAVYMVSPIPCTLTRFRYDFLPEERAIIRLRTFDSGGCVLGEGRAFLDISGTLPGSPNPIIPITTNSSCPR